MTNTIAFFDFDGTITKKDSLPDFIKFSVGIQAYYLGLLQVSPWLAAFKLGFISNDKAKKRLWSHFFKGWSIDKLKKQADTYSLEQIDKISRPEAMAKIRWHKEMGHKVVIVTASMECWLHKWCLKNDLDLIATKAEVKDGRLTGGFATPNCNYGEKVKRIKSQYTIEEYDSVFAYGDSPGDKEMLSLARKKYYRLFK